MDQPHSQEKSYPLDSHLTLRHHLQPNQTEFVPITPRLPLLLRMAGPGGKKVSVSAAVLGSEVVNTPGSVDNVNRELESLKATLAEAVRVVIEEKRCAVVDCIMEAL